jgi:hypothetical protein
MKINGNPALAWRENNFQGGDRETHPYKNRKKVDTSQKKIFTDFYTVTPLRPPFFSWYYG